MSKNSYGYVIVHWEVEPPAKEGTYPRVSFTVLDAAKGKTPKKVGSLKMYGNKAPKTLCQSIGEAVVDAQYEQGYETPAVPSFTK